MKRLTTLVSAAGCVLAVAAVTPASAKDIKIGVVNFTLCCSYFVGMDKAIADSASLYPNIKVISTDSKGDAAKLTSNVEDLLSQKVDGLVISGGPLEAAPEALDAAKKAGIKVVKAPDFGGWSVDGGFKVMDEMLAKVPDVNAVFCENDSMCQGAQKAIKDAGKSGAIFLASVDGEKGTLKEIMSDGTNFGATGQNNSDQIGRAGFNRLMAILAGASAPKQTVLPSPIITKDNAIKFYNPDSVF